MGDEKVIDGDFSVGHGFDDPLVPIEVGYDILSKNRTEKTIELTPAWSKTPIAVPLPVRIWNCRCLILNGIADAKLLSDALGRKEVMEIDPRPTPGPLFAPKPGSGKALVQLYGSDYVSTTLGSFKAVFALVLLPMSPDGQFRFGWWVYYGNSLVNKAFKEQVWGIVPNQLGVIETAYAGRRKAVRLLEQGAVALKMVWNSARFPNLVETPREYKFKTVAAARKYDNGENDVELSVLQPKRGDDERFDFPFVEGDDVFAPDKGSGIGKSLAEVGFKPASWECLLNYAGVVKIYDEKGSATKK